MGLAWSPTWVLQTFLVAIIFWSYFVVSRRDAPAVEDIRPRPEPKSSAATSSTDKMASGQLVPGLEPCDFDGIPESYLDSLKQKWTSVRETFKGRGYDADSDPVVSPNNPADLDVFLLRYLRAERNNATAAEKRSLLSDGTRAALVSRAAKRLVKTMEYRMAYDCPKMYRRGSARELFFHDTNPGGVLYFADRGGMVDREGNLLLVGRFDLINQAETVMEPANHLRAGLFVVERAVGALALPQRRVSYILDLGPVREIPGHSDNDRFWGAHGWFQLEPGKEARKAARKLEKDLPASEAVEWQRPGARPHLRGHAGIDPEGLGTLREALRMMTEFYPEFLHKVYFLRPSIKFRLAFAVFSLWVDATTRAKFVLVPEGQEDRLLEDIDPGTLPPEFHPRAGTGRPLEGDTFLLDACVGYDMRASLPKTPPPELQRPGLKRARVLKEGATVASGPHPGDPVIGVAQGQMDVVVELSGASSEPRKTIRVVWPVEGFVDASLLNLGRGGH